MSRLCWLVCWAGLSWGQAPQARDLGTVRVGGAKELQGPVVVPRGYAVVIGISEYQNLAPKDKLPFAEKDALNVGTVLLSKEGGNFAFEDVRRLLGKDATREKIREALEEWLPARATVNDRVVVYFVGHGIVDPAGRGYLAPYDVMPGKVAETGYPMDQLGEVLSKRVKAKWKVLLTDACHSGKVTVDTSQERINEGLRGMPQGFLTLSSSRAGQVSYEDANLAGGNGVFSYFLGRGWMGEADVDPRDGIVTADELVGYVQREVRSHVRGQGRQQNPQESGDFPDQMLLGFAAGRRSALAASVAEVSNGSVVVEANLEEVEVSIDGQRYGLAGPGKPLRVPGLASGAHRVEGIRLGYEPVTVEISVAPGTTQTVSLRLLHQRKVSPKAQAMYEEGEAIWRRSRAGEGDLRKAEERFGAALREGGQFGLAALGLCRVQQALSKSGEALKMCRRAVEWEGDRSESRMMLAVLLMESGDYNEAVRQLQRAEAQDSKSAFVPSLLAEALFEADRPKEAEAAAERAIGLNEASAQGYLLRGEARRVQGKFDAAMGDYQRSLGLGEFGSGALRVVAYWAIGSGMKKNRSGRQVLQRSQKAAAYYGLCACQLAKESYREAVRECKRVLGVEKEDGETYILLAQVYAEWFSADNKREYLEASGESLAAVLRINPNHAQAELFRKKVGEVRELLRAVR